MTTFNFVSPFPLDECRRRLEANVGRERFSGSVTIMGITLSDPPIPSKSGVVGKIGEERFRLSRANSSGDRGALSLVGEIMSEGTQTRLRCRTGMAPFLIFFWFFWFGMSYFILAKFFGRGPTTLTVRLSDQAIYFFEGWWVTIFPPLIPLCVGLLGWAACYFLAYRDEDFLIDFLRKTIDVREAEGARAE
jgi:hypothetical protein